MTKQEIPYFMQLLAVLTLRFFGFGYFGIRHLPNTGVPKAVSESKSQKLASCSFWDILSVQKYLNLGGTLISDKQIHKVTQYDPFSSFVILSFVIS